MCKNMKARIAAIVFAVFALFLMLYIFHNSMQSSTESHQASEKVAEKVQVVVDPENKIDTDYLNIVIRKSAHFFEFALFGFMLTASVFFIRYNKKHRILFTLPLLFFISLSVGVADEFIQLFSERTSRVADVLIDFGGAITGLLLSWGIFSLAYYIFKKIKEKRRNRSA